MPTPPVQMTTIAQGYYKYAPLAGPANTHSRPVRLLKILPGSETDVIECILLDAELDTHPEYEALSYVWGVSTPAITIICCGQLKTVTPNLGAALRRRRLPDKSRRMWIDAICIDQENLVERLQQVALMRDIYSQPTRVIVWLGDDENNIAHAAVFAIVFAKNSIIYCVHEIQSISDMHLDDDFGDDIDAMEDLLGSSDWYLQRIKRQVQWFYEREWFERIWVLQEVAFSHCMMYIGKLEIGWKAVALAATVFSRLSLNYDTTYIQRAQNIWERRNSPGEPLQKVLMRLQHDEFRSTDPRDKIYALLGLCKQTEEHQSLKADYEITVGETYTRFTRHFIESQTTSPDGIRLQDGLYASWRDLEILDSVSHSSAEFDTDFPSWIPRWDQNLPSDAFSEHPWNVSGLHRASLRAWDGENRHLVLKGLLISTIEIVWPTKPEMEDDQLELDGTEYFSYSSRSSHHESFWIRKIWDSGLGGLTSWAGKDTKEEAFVRAITAGADCRSLGFYHIPIQFFGNALRNLREAALRYNPWYSFFVSEGGHFGLAPKIAQPGDMICTFYGGRHLYFLRKVGSCYRFLGRGYMNDYMEGQAIDEKGEGKLAEQ
ncbi:HET-domain-containing protein [Mollisia scopiformis]|uniref:HET-domain-containing protein n=1 Tax=Mollisia scopiformis TaxID=149040 RepID=A0A194X2Q2_MOLSC|nr:HET-domain-containing protein [Mollisia scopiformis]KUJ14299.1 HET-domain-containing protein [Mollisia scopiformis]